jgi:hypothetical protein
MASPRRPQRSERPDVLIVHGHRDEGEDLARRVQALGFRPALAKTPQGALEMLADPRRRVGAALVASDLPVADLPAATAGLRAAAGDRRLELVAVGPRPGPDGLAELRSAGIHLVLWEPFPDAALRFQLNRALGEPQHERQRAHPRVPVARRVRILSGSFVRDASLYTLSPAGAFVETARPVPRKAPVSLELVLDDQDLSISGHVLYTNVPGNLQRANLPVGMAVRFERVGPGGIQAIDQCLRDAAERLDLDAPAAPPAAGRSWLRRLRGRGRASR